MSAKKVKKLLKSIYTYFKCSLDKHKYVIVQDFGDGTRRIGCPYCKKEWAMNDRTKTLLFWDFEFQSMYRNILGHKIKNPHWYGEH